MTTKVLALPKSLPSAEEFSALLDRYKSFRLLSLQLSPSSFGSSYDREIVFPEETWISRVSNPLSTNIVAVSTTSAGSSSVSSPLSGGEDGEPETAINSEWLASLTLVGPFDRATAATKYNKDMWINSPDTVMDDKIEWYFGLNAMYVLPQARGTGLGAVLVKYAKNIALEQVKGKQARILLVVDHDNNGARRTYEKGGFELVQRYWFDDFRQGRSGKTEAAVMIVDIGGPE